MNNFINKIKSLFSGENRENECIRCVNQPKNAYKRHLKISNKVGIKGEQLAKKFLVKHKYTILEQNYLEKCGEIDIIAQKTHTLYFFEVKSVSYETNSRSANNFRPEERVNVHKLRKMRKTIEMYLCRHKHLHYENIELGIMSVVGVNSESPEIKILFEY